MTLFKFEHQVKRYQQRVYGFAYHYLGSREEAEDVTQEVFIRFWNNRADIDEAQPLGWLLRVTRNAAVDAIRRRNTYRRNVSTNSEMLDYAEGHTASPARDAEDADFRKHLEVALDQMEEPYRSIVILREIQDLKYQEISETLELPLTTVKVYLHRGRKMLRQQLHEVLRRDN